MAKVAILYICIGKYNIFWEDFYNSFKKHFLLNSDVHYFVFTDDDQLIYKDNPDVHVYHQDDLGWPGNTLYRFSMFLTIKEELKKYDYIYFMNANYICMQDISEEEFLPNGNQLVVTLHPGYYDTPVEYLPYCEDRKSTAFISKYDFRAKHYFCGGLSGGSSKKYLKMIEKLNRQIRKDDLGGVIATWHDESHLNKYMLKQRNYKILSPAYAYAEELDIPFEKKMFLINKRNKIKLDHI